MDSHMDSRIAFDVFNSQLVGSNLIEASAGTGKTWSITGLYLRLVVEQNLQPENILVVTFTKAATAELTGRIRQRLQQAMSWINGDKTTGDVEFFSELFKKWEIEFSIEDIKQRLLKALAHFDQAAIFTIHSFCQRLLNDYAFEAGGRFNLTLLNDSQELLDTVVADFWRKKVNTLEANDAVWATWLIQQKQSPAVWRNAIRDFINKPYLKVLLPKGADPLDPELVKQLKALHSKVAEDWKKNAKSISADLAALMTDRLLNGKSYRLASLDKYVTALQTFLQQDLTKWFNPISKDASKFSQIEIESKLNKGKTVEEYPFFTALDQLIECHNKYCESIEKTLPARKRNLLAELLEFADDQLALMKSEQGLLDFDEMLLNVYKAISGDNGSILSNAATRQYQTALIDEFQDTDPLQLTIFQTLFAKTNTPLFYVGDPKQAIYSFRGADIHAYYQGAKASDTQQTLLTNYRSTPALVDSVNALFSPKQQSFIDESISFDWVSSNPKKKLVIAKQDEAALQFVIAEEEEQKPFSKGKAEPIAVANTVQQITDILAKAEVGDAYFIDSDGIKTQVSPSDIAILVPSHKQAKKIARALANQGVMSVRQGQDKVLKSDAAKTILRLMQAVAEPSDESRITELLADALVGFSGPEIVAMKEQGHEWENLLEQYWQLRATYLKNGFSAMFRNWLNREDSNGLTLPQRLVEFIDGERNLTDLMHLSEILQQRSRQQISLKGLINWLQYAINGNGSDDEHQLRLESDTQRVKIVTLHASKGLEYNIVFCPFLWQGQKFHDSEIISAHEGEQAVVDFGSNEFDEIKKQAEQDQLKEQLRLLYVALTRPVHRCVIFWAHVQSGQFIYTANSALAWLLYGDDKMTDNPVEQLRDKVKNMSFKAFVEGVEAFQQEASKRQPDSIENNNANISVTIIKEADKPSYVSLKNEAAEGLSAATLPEIALYPSWLTSSFSALTAGQHASLELQQRSEHADDVPDEQAVAQTEEMQLDELVINDTYSIFNFPRGAMPGECLHYIFEHWDFANTDKEPLKTLVADSMNRFSIAKPESRSEWYETVADTVLNTLNKPLKTGAEHTNFCLARVAAADRQPELEFLLAARGSTDGIRGLLANPKFQLPSVFVEASKQLSPKRIQGFLTGFIDLVFKDDEGKFHVLDWKSNHLGNRYEDYSPDRIEHAMAETHYYLQALIYLLALHRYLQQQIPDYNIEQHLGSAWYAFVRGVDINQPEDEPSNGIYKLSPSIELIMALDELLIKSEAEA
jgi:exodeoxyribonuclease V beta subunit